MNEVGVGIIGAGWGSRIQVPGFGRLPGVRVVGLVAARLERAEAAARPYGIEAYDDYRRLLDRPDVHLIAISTPPVHHHEMALAAIERGKHVLCEKPFTRTAAEAADLLAGAESAGIVHAVDFEQRFLAERYAMKMLVDDGFIGEPRYFDSIVTHRRFADPEAEVRPWSVDRAALGGALAGIGVHMIDYVGWLLGASRGVFGALQTAFPTRKAAGGATVPATADDMATVLVRFEKAAVASFFSSWAAGQPEQRLEVHGSLGSLVSPGNGVLLAGRKDQPLAPFTIEDRLLPAGGWVAPLGPDSDLLPPFVELATRLVARIRGEDGGEFPTFHDGLASQRILDAAYRSSDEGRLIAL